MGTGDFEAYSLIKCSQRQLRALVVPRRIYEPAGMLSCLFSVQDW